MNAYKHAEISVRNWGGQTTDYLPIHEFLDSTKELCSDNRHRILHTMWGIRRVVVPIFGQSLQNSDGKVVNVKDMCEQDHILPDYRNRFIPTLKDFVDALESSPDDAELLNRFFEEYKTDDVLTELLLSPLANTGSVKSLFITHNSWFMNEIIPKILKRQPVICDFSISPSVLFNRMKFLSWMDNGFTVPQSAKNTNQVLESSSLY